MQLRGQVRATAWGTDRKKREEGGKYLRTSFLSIDFGPREGIGLGFLELASVAAVSSKLLLDMPRLLRQDLG